MDIAIEGLGGLVVILAIRSELTHRCHHTFY
jgi:hypothetical protein